MKVLQRRENTDLTMFGKDDATEDMQNSASTHEESMSSICTATLAPPMDGSSSFLLSGSTTLNGREGENDIMRISRGRIDFGKFLGCGSFAQVYRVTGISKERKTLTDSFRVGSRSLRQLRINDVEEPMEDVSEKSSMFANYRRCKSTGARLDTQLSNVSMNDISSRSQGLTGGGARTPDDRLSSSARKPRKRSMGMASRFQSMRSLVSENEDNEKRALQALVDSGCAVKVLNHKQLKLPRALRAAAEDLMTEVQILKLCRDCPYVLRVRALPDIDDSDWTRVAQVDNLFIMTDELSETLDHRIKHWREHKEGYRSRDVLVQKTRYALQLCNALKFLHDHRIVYRDLKPENVGFITNKEDNKDSTPGYEGPDRIQLFDFGFSRELPVMTPIGERNSESWKMFYSKTHDESDNTDDGNTGVYCLSEASGSPKYLAGEVFLSGGHCNLKCDVYSWAMVFFEMLSDERAFPHFTVEQLEEVIWKRGSRPSLSKSECLASLPTSITGLLKKSWSKFVYKRPTTAECCKVLESILVELQK